MKYFLLCSLMFCLSNGINFTFDSTLEGWTVVDGIWHWNDRQHIPNILPPGPTDGFAVLDDDGAQDELFWPGISAPNGGQAVITCFVRSEVVDSNIFQLQKSYGPLAEFILIEDFGSYITTDSTQFLVLTVELPPDPNVYYIGFFCSNFKKAAVGQWFQGCAIDSLTVTPYSANPTTTQAPLTTTELPITTTELPITTTEVPISTTQAPISTTEVPVPTTQAPISTTQAPLTTTELPITTTELPITTTELPITTTEIPISTTEVPISTTEVPMTTTQLPLSTTEIPISTTEIPISTTEVPISTTPEPAVITTTLLPLTTTQEPTTTVPPGSNGFNFSHGMDGWTLSHMNGAYWIRSFLLEGSGVPGLPETGPWIIEVIAAEQYSGNTLAQSPYFEATSSEMQVEVTFWMEGSEMFPCQLKVRKRNSIDTFDPVPIMNLNSYGALNNSDWITMNSINTVNIGERFVIVIEASLGGKNSNRIYITEIVVTGVDIVPVLTNVTYDFEEGLTGFSSGNMASSRWSLFDWNDGGAAVGYPQPEFGSKFLVVEKFGPQSGIATIETPPVAVDNDTTWRIIYQYWIKASSVSPVSIRLRIKTDGGRYQEEPFINRIYDSDAPLDWRVVALILDINLIPDGSEYFQIILEADIGSNDENLLAIDNLQISPIVS